MSHAKAVRRAVVAVSLAAAAVIGTSLGAGAAAPATPVAASAKTPAAPAGAAKTSVSAPASATKDIWDQTPYPLYEEKERVDPFTRGKPPKTTITIPGGGRTGPDLDKLLGKSLRAYDEAGALLSADRKERYALCVDACQKGIQDLRQTIADISKDEALVRHVEPARSLMESFLLLEATAKRLKQRQDVEAEFVGLKITVVGIVWNEQSPAAAVNGQVANEGTVLKLGAGGQDVQVHRIRRDAVVFLYKGVQISVRLDRGGL
jgi:hypothetical protein